ncbi:MAG: hypothetical protein H7X88_03480 [Gloeobacteraceae cyanobacterium ES-bin-316]|nr:hypothetical protein [Ferruginibacter sp.]
MQELITRLVNQAGISSEQAAKTIDTIKDFVKEKFPMMSGAVDNLFAGQSQASSNTFPEAPIDPTVPAHSEPSMFDKISDLIPGETGQRVEDFAKKAADKAEDLYGNAKDKLSDMFGNEKK